LAKDGVSFYESGMTYVYLIESEHFKGHHYVGTTDDLKQRFAHHNAGKSQHTSKFQPWHLVAYTAFADRLTAAAFEKYLKSGSGKAFLSRHYFRKP
jgi:predicted GIY-YIG superfamily endonuclease